MTRVAFVLSALGAGGAERVVNLISRAAVRAGWHVTIISFDRPDDPIYEIFDSRIVFQRLAIPPGFRFVPRRLLGLRRALRNGGFDAAVSFLTKINVLTLASTIGLRLPVIVSERNNPRGQEMHPSWKVALAFLYARADAIVMQTRRSLDCLPRRHRARALVIPNPVKLSAGPAPDRGSRQVVAAGRLTHQKGFDLLIAAFAAIAGERQDWDLVIWGEGPERPALEQQVAAAGLKHRIFLPGLSAAPGSWVRQGGIFVLSSRYEGFPNALIEAMASGLPVIAFDCEFGPAELIEHDRTGLLIDSGAIRQLSRSLAELMQDDHRRHHLGLAARTSVARLGEDRITSLWLAHIGNACRSWQKP